MSLEPTDDGPSLDPGFADRLSEIVKSLGGDVAAGKVAEVHRQTILDWRKGRGRISLASAVSLARAAGKSLEWLVEGAAETQLSRKALRASAIKLGGTVSIVDDDGPIPAGYVAVPTLSVRASAGSGRLPGSDDGVDGILAFRETWLREMGLLPGRSEVLTAAGDSMDPTIRDGDMLLVDRSIDHIVNQGIYVLVLNGLVLVKRVLVRLDKQIVIKSDNPLYGEETVSPDDAAELIIVGRVRLCARMM